MEVKPGNIHDIMVFDTVYDRITQRFPEIEVITADSGYKTPWICKKVFDDNRIPSSSLPYKRPMTKKKNLPWYKYVYDEYYDWIICPEYKSLNYSTTNKNGYREYKSRPYICINCPKIEQCTTSKNHQKTVARHIWHDYIEQGEDVRHSLRGKETYSMRSQTVERVFADAKQKHGMRYTQYRGLEWVSNWIKLKYTAMNLKKLAMWKYKSTLSFDNLLDFLGIFAKNELLA